MVVTPPSTTCSSRSSHPREVELTYDDFFPVSINLNIGGEKFITSGETLCRVKGSYFESMISGRFSVQAATGDGSVFVDRDPSHFHHILNFLRAGCLLRIPTDASEKEELALDADFYGLEEMVRAIRMPAVDVTEGLVEEVRRYREMETKLRANFARRHDADILSPQEINLHEGLLPLFRPDLGLGELPLLYNRSHEDGTLPDSECLIMLRKKEEIMLRKKEENSQEDKIPVTVKSMEEFRTNFNSEHPNILSRLTPILAEEPIVIAGGSVLCALTGCATIRTVDWWGKTSDIDLFLYCQSPEEANRIARRVFYALATDNEKWVIVRSRGVINLDAQTKYCFL
eukprot:scaffold3676_cov166-Amphora_coffeaeformis.AAC.9